MTGREIRLTPLSELAGRAARLQQLMRNADIDGIIMVQNADLFYFAGTIQRSHLFIPAEGSPVLMVKKSFDRGRQESALENVMPLNNLKELPEKLKAITGGGIKRIGFELDVLPANLFVYYQKLLKPVELLDASQLIRTVRAVKSSYELEILKDAALLNRIMFSRVEEILQEDMTEVELAGQLEAIYRRQGHQSYIRMRGFNAEIAYGHVMSGWNLAVPSFFDGPKGGTGLNTSFPQGAGFKRIARNEPVMVDYVGVYDGYMVDQARMFCIGRLPEKMVRAYNVALEIQEMVKERARPGISCAELYGEAVRIAGKYRLEDHFMGYPEPVTFIGHGVGIELDELPVLAKGFHMPLAENMVFALEPNFIFPEGGVGIENTFVVKEKGLEAITAFDENIICLP